MWECNNCETENEDTSDVCDACGSGNVEEVPAIQTNISRSFKAKKQGAGIVSKGFYMGSIIGGFALMLIFGFLAGVSIANGSEATGLFVVLAVGISMFIVVLFAKLWYKAWESIQDGHARTTPGKAVGFLFIPIFNFYWVFQLSLGFAKDFNSYINRHKITVSRIPEGLFLAFAIFSILSIGLSKIPGAGIVFTLGELIISLVVVSNLCDAINSIPANPGQVGS